MNDSELEKYEMAARCRTAAVVDAAKRGLIGDIPPEELVRLRDYARGRTTLLRFFLPSPEEPEL